MDPSRQEMNPYAYGGNNPIINVDPSGHVVCHGEVCQTTPPISRPYIKGPTLYQQTSLEFAPRDDFRLAFLSTGVIPESQFDPPRGSGNLCGVYAVAAILQNLGVSLGVDEIIDNYDSNVESIASNKDTGSSWEEIADLVQTIPGYTTEPIPTIAGTNSYYYSYTSYSIDEYYNQIIRKEMREQKYPIIRVGYQETPSSWIFPTGYKLDALAGFGHFVVITGLSVKEMWEQGSDWQWVRIYNPFRNGTEYYKANVLEEFQSGVGNAHETMYVCHESSSGNNRCAPVSMPWE